MNFDAKRPEDILADNNDFYAKGNTQIRKGTVAAALANAEVIEAFEATVVQKQKAMMHLKELVPALKELGLTKYLRWNNPEIQALFD